jgi:DNA repair protein RecN (Recombination protein N)
MIREIRIKNLALIDNVTIGFEDGFSVLTGETGAGKSIMVGAINLLLGERASADIIRSGTEEAEVSGVFELAAVDQRLTCLCQESDIPLEDGSLIIRRTVSRSGRNRIYINQVPVPLATLKAVGDFLIDLHGQHEHQSLLNPHAAYGLIDALPQVAPVSTRYAQAWTALCGAREQLQAFDAQAAELGAKRDLIEFQFREIAALQPKAGEEPELDNDGPGLQQQCGQIRKKLEALQKFDPAAEPWLSQLEAAQSFLGELNVFCASYLSAHDAAADPTARLEEINSRLAKIQRLKKKYHCTFDELIEKQRQLQADLQALENVTADRSAVAEKCERTLRDCLAAGKALSTARNKATREFDAAISKQMNVLGFTDGKWRTASAPLPEPAEHGMESVCFEVQTNPGEPFLPLAKTASGGEISRLMLAIKTVMADNDHIPVLVFDEIDTGIGGHIATAVGAAMRQLSVSHQVICISHLHQIASEAQRHYRVFKVNEAGRTFTQIVQLDEKERVDEIARMLGSDSPQGRRHAEEIVRRHAEHTAEKVRR